MYTIQVILFIVGIAIVVAAYWSATTFDKYALKRCLDRVQELRHVLGNDDVFPAVFAVTTGQTVTYSTSLVILYIQDHNVVLEVMTSTNILTRHYESLGSPILRKPTSQLVLWHHPQVVARSYGLYDKVPGATPGSAAIPHLVLYHFVLNDGIQSEESFRTLSVDGYEYNRLVERLVQEGVSIT